MTEDGSCQSCGDYEIQSSTNSRECVLPICESNQKIQIDGTCLNCEDYTIPDIENQSKSCIRPTCGVREKIDTNG